MNTAALGHTVLIGQLDGDRPAVITKVFNSNTVEACGFMPAPEVLKLVKLHISRAEAINATQKDTGYHAYWPAKV